MLKGRSQSTVANVDKFEYAYKPKVELFDEREHGYPYKLEAEAANKHKSEYFGNEEVEFVVEAGGDSASDLEAEYPILTGIPSLSIAVFWV